MTKEEQDAERRKREEEAAALLLLLGRKKLAMFLYDAMVRRQIYLEGLKLYYVSIFEKRMGSTFDQVHGALAKLKITTLSDLNRAQFLVQRKKITDIVEQGATAWAKEFAKDLTDFLPVEVDLAHKIYDISEKPTIVSAQNTNRGHAQLWASIRNAFVPASGLTIGAMLASVIGTMQAKVLKVVTTGYTDAQTNDEVAAEVQKLLGTIVNGGRGVISTVMQHVSASAHETVAATQFGEYVWTSVIDSHTTDICRSRNMKVYQYGRGPIPPAHYGCRSVAVPVVDGVSHTKQSYYQWLKSQPEDVQDDILGRKRARDLRSGELKADDLDRFDGATEISLEQYSGKAGFILRKGNSNDTQA